MKSSMTYDLFSLHSSLPSLHNNGPVSHLSGIIRTVILISVIIFSPGCREGGGYAGAGGSPREARELIYRTEDGWTIHATFHQCRKEGRPLLVAIHMLMSDRSYFPVTGELTRFCNVLKIDMRGHGESVMYHNRITGWRSGRGDIYFGSFKDISAGIKEVKRLYGDYVDTSRLFLQGSSYSCVLVLQYYLQNRRGVRGLIFMSPGDSYGQRIVSRYKSIVRSGSVPVIQVCSRKDFYCITRTRAMEKIYRAAMGRGGTAPGASSSLTRFIYEDDHVHGTHFFYTHPKKYPSEIIGWMKTVLGGER